MSPKEPTIKSLTKLPVKYLVTTHWHDDHIFGNQEYLKAYPGISIIAQTETRGAMIRHGVEHQQQLIDHYDKAIPRVEHLLSTGRNSKGDSVPPDAMTFWKAELPVYKEFVAEMKTMKVVLPTITFDSSLTLYLGAREIRVFHFLGNTRGDATIWLPKERIADIGDLVVYPVPYIYGGYPVSWSKALASVKALDPSIIVLGHGPVQRDLTYFGQVTALMDAMSTQVGDAVKRGLSIEDTRKGVDFSALHDQIVRGDEVREDTWQSSIMQAGVESAWKDAKGVDQGD